MHRIIIYCFLAVSSVHAQQSYLFEPGTEIYDIEGSSFFAYKVDNNKLSIQEIGQDGSVLWSDSIPFFQPQQSIDAVHIEHFKNTEVYGIFLQHQLTDTLIVEGYALSLQNYNYLGNNVDTLLSDYVINTCSYADTNLYLMTTVDQSGVRKHAAFSVNQAMDFEQVAPLDSIITNPVTPSLFYSFQDSIYHLFDLYGTVYNNHYSNDFSQQGAYTSVAPPIYDYSTVIYRKAYNQDSLFFMRYAYNFATDTNAWVFSWMNHEFEVLNEFHHTYSNNQLYYSIGLNKVVLTDNSIVILATTAGPGVVFENYLFEYDHQFNFICSYLLDTDPNNTTLTALNGSAYLKIETLNDLTLHMVDDCGIAASPALAKEQKFHIYPNPTSEQIQLTATSDMVGKEFIVVNQWGSVVVKYTITSTNMLIDLSHLPAGVYFFNAEGNTQKIVKY